VIVISWFIWSSYKHLRSSTEWMLNFWEHCLFCGEECQITRPQKNPSRWREAYLCKAADREGQISFKESVIRHAERRSDNWGNDVSFRAHSDLRDLHAADARYHKDCMSRFFSNHPTAFTQPKHDGAVEELIKQLNQDPSRIWNSVELYKQYEDFSGKVLSRRLLINYRRDTLHPDLLVLSSPGMASVVMFRSKASTTLCIANDADDDCNSQTVSSLGSKIRNECLTQKPRTGTYATHISLDSVTTLQGNAVKLYWHY